MQFKTPESALQAKSQEATEVAKTYSPHNGSSARAGAMSPMNSKPAAADASAELAAFETRFGEQATAARRSIKEMSRDLADRARQSATATDDYVHAQPWKAIGLGAAIGVALGVLFARR
jgi:ElaB/YqjD/DUF883 family membrane-anchored ribosome-binding protein